MVSQSTIFLLAEKFCSFWALTLGSAWSSIPSYPLVAVVAVGHWHHLRLICFLQVPVLNMHFSPSSPRCLPHGELCQRSNLELCCCPGAGSAVGQKASGGAAQGWAHWRWPSTLGLVPHCRAHPTCMVDEERSRGAIFSWCFLTVETLLSLFNMLSDNLVFVRTARICIGAGRHHRS